MNEETLEILEWDKILERLIALCETEAGADAVSRPTFHTDTRNVNLRLDENRQMRSLLATEKPPEIRDLSLFQQDLDEAKAGATLQADLVVKIMKSIRTTEGLRKYFRERKGKYPLISQTARGLSDLSGLRRNLEEAIDYEGELKDTASENLPLLRRRVESARKRVMDTAQTIMASPRFRHQLQDRYVTIRNGRHVLPFKPQAKGLIRGILHETSQSGQTIFLEPEELLHANNELKSAESELSLEIQRIMRRLSKMIGERGDEIGRSVAAGAAIDGIQARSFLAEEMGAEEPRVNDNGLIEIISARNPLLLLGKKRAVPSTVSLSSKHRCMIVTGPNAGGKTVLIKTIGLLTLMAMAGLSLPAGADTRISLFPRIFVAMGDMQSVEKDLSTFSADIITMKNFFDEADERTLVLLDEVITGTDPKEGTALGQAYLKALINRGATVFVTTHFDEIKYLPYEDDRFIVASMGFDEKDLTPTFQLTIGIPGRSMGIQIAEKIGFPEPIIRDAKSYLGAKEEKIDSLIKELSGMKEKEAKEVKKLTRERSRLKEMTERGKQDRAMLKEREREVMDEARSRARTFLRKAEEEVEVIMGQLRKERKVDVVRKAKDVISKMKKEAGRTDLPDDVQKAISQTFPVRKSDDLSPGQKVFVVSLGKDGHVETAGDGKGKVTVSLGHVTSTVPVADLRLYDRADKKGRMRERDPRQSGKKATSPHTRRDDNTIDVRGLDQVEAIREVDLFLDRASLKDIPSVFIIHGHGTGMLKKSIRSYLRTSPYVDAFSPAPREQGGDGTTIVNLK